MSHRVLPGLLLLSLISQASAAEPTSQKSPKEALQAVQDLIGPWRGTGEPQQGTREEKQKGFWTETIDWAWQFKGEDVFLKAAFEKSKYFTSGELRYVPATDRYRLVLQTAGKETVTFEGELKKRRLILERTDEGRKEIQRLTFNMLHANRYVYRFEAKPIDQTVFTAVYQVGATKEGVPFASGDGKPVCIVSGGLGTSPVMYKGITYYVCCSGCRDAFMDEPEKYIKEFEAKKNKKD
jgi:hypothetical protein